ncbi:MAG: 50S ribosomal protein L2 [Thermoplasmatales archaeon]|jgi:large subunit ribosomal protein L2|nr:50S ribosomal protein L2 [Thermoplasmatales archaeon]
MGKRLRPQRRGRGTPRYRSPSHRHVDDVRLPAFNEGAGTITDLIHAPGRSSPLAVVDFNGTADYQLAAEGMSVGQRISVGPGEIAVGNIMRLSAIPEGTAVHNIEKIPGDGGKFVKAAGASAQVVSRGSIVVLQMPSGEMKDFHPECRAVVGVVAGGGRTDKPLAKAGKKHHTHRSIAKDNFHVSGVSMNPVDHPHGGGSHPHVGGPSTVSRNAWPGQKVGRLSPQKKKKKR